MPLPANFNRWRHLLSVLMRAQNRIVRDYFKDPDRPDEDLDISVSKESLRTACLLQVTDSAIVASHRLALFYSVLGQGRSEIYGMPIESFQESVSFKPQIWLLFREPAEDTEEGYTPIESEISFRLVGETAESYTEAKARSLALKIKNELGGSTPFAFRKGKLKFNYRDEERGYRLSILASSEDEGERIVKKILSLQNHIFNNDFVSLGESRAPMPIIPPTKSIMGKSVRMPRKRPVGMVRFQRAELKIWGVRPDIVLYSASGSKVGLVN